MIDLDSRLSNIPDDLGHDEAPVVADVLEAIDQLLDAIEDLDAPVTRELLGLAMTALVEECKLSRSSARLN